MAGTIDHANFDLKIDTLALGTAEFEGTGAVDAITVSKLLRLSNGTSSGQASQIWRDQRTLSASATENLDLAGSLTNAFGSTITFTSIKAIYVFAATANTNDVQVIRGASNGVPIFLAAGDGQSVKPGGVFFIYAPGGWTVTAGTGDILTVTNSAGSTSVTYDIIIVGTD